MARSLNFNKKARKEENRMPIIQVKRGSKANVPTLLTGEFGLATDTGELFIGGASNNLEIPVLDGNGDIQQDQIPQIAASYISSGTFAGQVVANASATGTISTAQVRNIYAGTSDMTSGTTSLTSGTIYFVYE